MTAHENAPGVDESPYRRVGNGVLSATQSALTGLMATWREDLVQDWCATILARKGRVVLTGIGKSGLIAQKISATLASTGCPSFFLHPAEALHGDLGMVTSEDAAVALSNSGESEEIVRLLPSLLRLGVPLAAITGRSESSLGKASKWCFTYDLPSREGCPLDLAPMASTTLQLIWGDLLAAALMEARGFTQEGFALNHPSGSLGAKFVKTKDLMHKHWPRVAAGDDLIQVLHAITRGRMGMAMVMEKERLMGVISDGDLRRGMERAQSEDRNPWDLRAQDLMSRSPVLVSGDALAIEAANLMEDRKITFLVVGDGGRPAGVLHIHDLLASKVL